MEFNLSRIVAYYRQVKKQLLGQTIELEDASTLTIESVSSTEYSCPRNDFSLSCKMDAVMNCKLKTSQNEEPIELKVPLELKTGNANKHLDSVQTAIQSQLLGLNENFKSDGLGLILNTNESGFSLTAIRSGFNVLLQVLQHRNAIVKDW